MMVIGLWLFPIVSDGIILSEKLIYLFGNGFTLHNKPLHLEEACKVEWPNLTSSTGQGHIMHKVKCLLYLMHLIQTGTVWSSPLWYEYNQPFCGIYCCLLVNIPLLC